MRRWSGDVRRPAAERVSAANGVGLVEPRAPDWLFDGLAEGVADVAVPIEAVALGDGIGEGVALGVTEGAGEDVTEAEGVGLGEGCTPSRRRSPGTRTSRPRRVRVRCC
jgi:hypothetical protein